MASVQEISANGKSIDASEVEKKLDEGNIEDAESSLRENLSLNHEEARMLLGRLEYQRRNFESALHVLEGIDIQEAIQRLQPSAPEKAPSRRTRSCDSLHPSSQHVATLVLETIYLKSLSLQKLGKFHGKESSYWHKDDMRKIPSPFTQVAFEPYFVNHFLLVKYDNDYFFSEAAEECRTVLDSIEKIFHFGTQDASIDSKLQEVICKSVELLPELWKLAGFYQEVISSYRRALLSQWSLDNDCCARIQRRFAVFLLHGSIEAGAPNLLSQVEGSFVPKHNIEEAILLLMIFVRKYCLGKIKWDPSIMEHLTFALTICGQTSLLAQQYEELLPGVYPRCDRWNSLALCYGGSGNSKSALNLLRRSLKKHERPDDLLTLLFAAKLCSDECLLAAEGAEYAERALAIAHDSKKHIKGVALRFLGICLGRQSKVASSDYERSCLQSEALKSLEEAVTLEYKNPDLLYEIGLEYAEHHNMNAALKCAKKFIDTTGGSMLKGWRLLALILSAQHRYLESEVVTEAALDETTKWEQGPLLRIKAKLKAAQNLPTDSVEIYRFLLALVQAQRKPNGSVQSNSQVANEKINDSEFEVWHGLANLYFRLSQWRDTETCLEKARTLKPYSAVALSSEGALYEARGNIQAALASYSDAVSADLTYVPSKVSIGALLWKIGSRSSSVARGFLSDALRIEPTNRAAWFYLGMVHKDDGRLADAAECFQASAMLDESGPIESYTCTM